ncbi:hypothetical protein ANCDUO_05078 [Ancylostoma duodenale]|uniref:Uncharacterized protein n=1 Tax=Ancylostoma duodenale TaxID=51022 RepID=A0A0C2H5C0_9BILA|nr:hypothetical protein ANCDUO_05078 [Ancylostoma duodenale]
MDPVPIVTKGRSPAENFIGLGSYHVEHLEEEPGGTKQENGRVIQPPQQHPIQGVSSWRCSAVWVRDYRKDQAKGVYEKTHRRHANQLRPRTAEDTEQKLLDLFDLLTECQRHPTKAVSIPMPTPATTLTRPTESDGNDPSTATSTSRPLRRSTRQRRAPIPLNMDPSRKTYLQM